MLLRTFFSFNLKVSIYFHLLLFFLLHPSQHSQFFLYFELAIYVFLFTAFDYNSDEYSNVTTFPPLVTHFNIFLPLSCFLFLPFLYSPSQSLYLFLSYFFYIFFCLIGTTTAPKQLLIRASYTHTHTHTHSQFTQHSKQKP